MDRRVVAAVCAVLLVATGPGVAAVPWSLGALDAAAASGSQDAAAASADAGMPARLGLPDDGLVRTGEVAVGPDLGTALAAGTGGVHAQYAALLVRERYHTATSKLARQRLLARELDGIAARAERLHEREREAVRRYAAGDLGGRALLQRLARTDREAERLRELAETVGVLAAGLPDQSLGERADAVDVRLAALEGPVRDRVGAAIAGREPAVRVHVEAAETGLVLGVLANETYVREATRTDYRDDATGEPAPNVALASQRAIALYPWAFNNSESSNIEVLTGDVFRVTVTHELGSLTGFVDSSTGRVYREIQRQDVPALPTRRIATVDGGDVRLAVERSYAGGPLHLALANESPPQSIDPIGTPGPDGSPAAALEPGLADAVVIVDNRSVGRTGPDGSLWLVEPRGPYTLTVVHGATHLSVTVDPRLAMESNRRGPGDDPGDHRGDDPAG